MPQMVYQLNNLCQHYLQHSYWAQQRAPGALLGLSSVSQNEAFTTNGPFLLLLTGWSPTEYSAPSKIYTAPTQKTGNCTNTQGQPVIRYRLVSGALCLALKCILDFNVKYVSFKIDITYIFFSGCINQRFSFTRSTYSNQNSFPSCPPKSVLLPPSTRGRQAFTFLFLSQYRFLNNREGVPQ